MTSYLKTLKPTKLNNKGVRLPKFKIDQSEFGSTDGSEEQNYEFFRNLCSLGLKNKIKSGEIDVNKKQDYVKQAKYELKVIKDLGFIDYFLLVWEVVNYCREQDIAVGVGRGCLSGDSLIRCNNGLKPIRNIDVGDIVLDGFGKWVKVKNKFKYSNNKPLIGFDIHGGESPFKSKFTEDHEVLVIKNPFDTVSPPRSGYKNWRSKMNSAIEHKQWIKAKDVKVGDYLIRYQNPENEFVIDFLDLADYTECEFNDDFIFEYKARNVADPLSIKTIFKKIGICPSTITTLKKKGDIKNQEAKLKILNYLKSINKTFKDFQNFSPKKFDRHHRFIACEDFYYLLGLYIGDGSYRNAEICIALNTLSDVNVINWIIKFCEKYKMNYRQDFQKGKNLVKFCISNKSLQKCITKFCSGKTKQSNKRINFKLTEIPDNGMVPLYNGMLDSDGCILKSHKRVNYDSVTYEFVHLFRSLYEKINKKTTFISRREPDETKKRPRDSFKCSSRASNMPSRCITIDNYSLLRVKNVNTYDGIDEVYDFSVSGGNYSYSTENFSVHNSAGGSVLLFLSGITKIDPIKHNLIFERFLSTDRVEFDIIDGEKYFDGGTLPDIDLDFDYYKRPKLLEYLQERYDAVKILNLNTFAGKQLVKDCGKTVAEYSEDQMNAISSLLPVEYGKVMGLEEAYEQEPDFKEWCDNNKEIYQIACKLRGLIRNRAVHASGMLIPFGKSEDNFPMELTSGKDKTIVSSYDMGWSGNIAIKLDVLGLKTLAVVDETCKMIGIKYTDIDVNDPFIYRHYQDFNYPYGIFQLEAWAAQNGCKSVKPKNLDELSAVLAICRPGALQFLEGYSKYTNTGESESPEPYFDDILQSTGAFCLYQEQLMKMIHKIGFSLNEANKVRKIVGKKRTEKVKEWKEKIYKKVEEKGLNKSIADNLWGILESSANYSFNKCLSPDTTVETPKGYKMMFEVKIGDKIAAYDVENSKDHYVEVEEIFQNEVEVYEIEMENGSIIQCSLDHKFLCKDQKMRPIRQIIEEKIDILCK